VVGVPSQKYGEEVGAFIILKGGADVTAADVKDFCRGQIARYKIPKYVAFVDSFPLTASGKVQKYKLQERSLDYFPDADPG
jgi:fatty-acyl-CoA synthase